jgi:hypothetical protein
MFSGLLNYIDQLYLSHYEKKLQEVQLCLARATKQRDNLLVGRGRLLEIKHVRSQFNVVYCNNSWIDLEQADRKIEQANQSIAVLTREDYEKYGTARMKVKLRVAARNAKIVGQRTFGSSVI